MSSSCLGRAAVPVKRVWRGLSARLLLRRATGRSSSSSSSSYYTPVDRGSRSASDGEADDGVMGAAAGLGRLRKEVRTCEYSDVHVMWEMLSSSKSTRAAGAGAGAMGGGAGGAGKVSRRARVGRKAAVDAWSRLASSYCCVL